LDRRLDGLERRCPPPPPPPPEDLARRRRWQGVLRRWDRLLGRALPLLAPAEEEAGGLAVGQLGPDLGGPYGVWLRGLGNGRSRLPALLPEAMKGLLLAWLSPEADGGMVCRGCGLEYPRHKYPPLGQWKVLPGKRPLEGPPPWYDLPEFFAACPHCGGSR